MAFLLPALVLLGALVVYPIGFSVYRSFFDQSGDAFAGFDNYVEIFTEDTIRTAIKNNLIWVIVAPTVATALGLIFAVLTERVRWGTAFKLIVFMPMAISMLASGIIFRLVYEQAPERGIANAVAVGVHDTFSESAGYPKARPLPVHPLKAGEAKGSFVTKTPVTAGTPVLIPLVGVPPGKMPSDAEPPRRPGAAAARSPVRPGWTSPRAAAASPTSSTPRNSACPASRSRRSRTARSSRPPAPPRTVRSPCRRRRTEPCSSSPRATSGSRTTAWTGSVRTL